MKVKSQKPKVSKTFTFLLILFPFSFFLFPFLGCYSIKEGIRGFAGVSTKVLEEGRKDAITESLNLDYFSCFTRTIDFLKASGAYIYANNIKKHMIAFYVSEQDTTPVGVFFKEIDANNTEVQVSSPSTYAKELFAEKLLNAFKPEK
jgi:hypothetical protein